MKDVICKMVLIIVMFGAAVSRLVTLYLKRTLAFLKHLELLEPSVSAQNGFFLQHQARFETFFETVDFE